MGKILKRLFCVVLICLLLAAGVFAFGFWLPVFRAQTSMDSEGTFTITQQRDGSLTLSWPEAEGADLYRVELLQPAEGAAAEATVVYRQFADEAEGFVLPEIPEDIPLILRVSSGATYRTLLEEGTRFSENALEVTAVFNVPKALTLETSADASEMTLELEAVPEENSLWWYQLLDETGKVLTQDELSGTAVQLQFGEGGFPLPEESQEYRLLAGSLRETQGIRFLGTASQEIPITRDSLTVWTLEPVLTKNSKYNHTITWNENLGMDYEVQIMDAKTNTWETIAEISAGEERSYSSPWLEPENIYQYRVVSLDPEKDGEYAAVSDPLIFETKGMVTYATVWPVRDLTAYSDPHWNNAVGTAKGGQAYCVLEEQYGMFAVRIDGEICYIDSKYCMINLPDYIGDLCSYNITNSAYSIYAVHEFAIPNVTGVITPGYEDVYQEDGSFLVPLLYPTAQKLYVAAQKAIEQGYRLKIYDSFRPYIATREIYDLTEQVLYMKLPDTTYTGQPRSSVTDLPETPRPGASDLDLGWVMTGHNYVLNAFLARTGSMHNLGIAVDLTLENLKTGEEIPMQSSMHDLSQYSVLGRNNEAADTLGNIMHSSGFGGLISEWWHFQDNNAKASLGLPYVQNGVSAECWVKDDYGWKYRTAKGGFYENETVTIEGKDYAFDGNGYVIE